MAPRVTTYDPRRVILTVSGAIISGYADGTFLKITPMTVGVSSKVGADGEVGRSISPDTRVEITLNLQQQSLSNIILNTLFIADASTAGGATFPILMEDLSGLTTFASSQCWVRKRAEVNRSMTEQTNVEWMLEAVPASLSGLIIGGTAS